MTETTTAFCPYVGLQPYTEAERDYFFGRERDIRVISSNLYASSLTILYGASGVGKSSVLLAGVVPHLRAAPRTAVIVFREWQEADFLPALKRKCAQAIEAAQQKPLNVDMQLPFDEFLHAAAHTFGGTLLLIFDQFEEYFLYHPEKRTDNIFDSELARAVNREEIDASFLLALREDGLAKLDRFRSRIPNLLSNTLRLQHMDSGAAEEALRKPLGVYNKHFSPPTPITIEEPLVQAILAQVRTGQVMLGQSSGSGQTQRGHEAVQIEAPFLQLVMTRLWKAERQQGSSILRLQTLERLGGAEQIVRTHLDDVMQQLDATAQEVCSRFFDRLVTPSGAKLVCRIDDLTNWAGDLADYVAGVLKALADSRILRNVAASTGNANEGGYEIFHDVLAPGILDWRARYLAERRRILIEKQAEAEAAEREKERIHHRELEQTRALAEAERQRAAEQQQRLEEQTRHAQQLHRLLAGLIVVLVLAVAAALLALSHRHKAITARIEAEQEREHAKEALESARKALAAYQAVKQDESQRASSLWEQAQTSYATAMRPPDERPLNVLRTAPRGQPLVYLQIRVREHRADSRRLQELLKKNGFEVPGIEYLEIGPTAGTEVRFFKRGDAAEANKIAALLQDARVQNVQAKYIPGFETSRNIPPRQYEIWFAPEAFARQ